MMPIHIVSSIYSDGIHAANIIVMQKGGISMIQTMQISLINTAVLPVQVSHKQIKMHDTVSMCLWVENENRAT